MKLIFGGVRGSWPVADSAFVEYGGATTSFLVEASGGGRLLIDFGTGMRALGDRLVKDGLSDVIGLVTHFHLDHLMGLPSFPLLYRDGATLRFASAVHEGRALEGVLSDLIKQPFWPVQLESMTAETSCRSLDDEKIDAPETLAELDVRWAPVEHEGGCTSYRLDDPRTGGSAVIATDFEWPRASGAVRERFIRLCRTPKPADVLVLDGQYTPEEYPRFAGWGHGTWENAVEIRARSEVNTVYITHHAPTRDDRALHVLESSVQARFPFVQWARQGEALAL